MKVTGLLFAFFILLIPTTSRAYFTTAQSATRLTNETILYTVTYYFGFANRELYMPILAKRTDGEATKQYQIEYSIFNDNVVFNGGTSTALVLTNDKDVKIKNGQYYLEPGRAASFTLVTFLTLPDEQQLDGELSLLVTQLPFTMIKGDEVIKAHLNQTELEYYRTPEVKI